MKKLLLPLLLFFSFGTFAQKIIKTEKVTDHSTHIVGDNFEGVIFSKAFVPAHYNYLDSVKIRFSPSVADIILAERTITRDVKRKGRGKINDPFICANLNKYLRQYIGYVDSTGEKIILINFFWRKEILDDERDYKTIRGFPEPTWKKEWFMMLDGGHYYWQIKVNLSTLKLFEFGENGEG